ncbi:MAG: DUF2628 domain-containing protein [Hyphomicrobiaceae bacterium]|nr:DUF2628 domain-containing protein [Hyphomicrobiaceae bacterium]
MIVTVWPFQAPGRMTAYTVHEPPNPAMDRIDRADAMVFLKDAFSWSAFLLGPIWLLANRLWLALVGYVAGAVAVGGALQAIGADPGATVAALFGINAVIGYEAHLLRAAKLTSSGWSMLGTITGTSIAECERRFFEQWLPAQPVLRTATAGGPAANAGIPDAPRVEAAAYGSPAAPTAASNQDGGASKPRRGFGFFRRKH